jgi:hypothetical protein
MGADGVGSKKLEKCFLWCGVLKRNEDGEIDSTDGVGNSLAGVIPEGVGKNAGVDTTSTVASPFMSRMGEIGVKMELEEVIESLVYLAGRNCNN